MYCSNQHIVYRLVFLLLWLLLLQWSHAPLPFLLPLSAPPPPLPQPNDCFMYMAAHGSSMHCSNNIPLSSQLRGSGDQRVVTLVGKGRNA